MIVSCSKKASGMLRRAKFSAFDRPSAPLVTSHRIHKSTDASRSKTIQFIATRMSLRQSPPFSKTLIGLPLDRNFINGDARHSSVCTSFHAHIPLLQRRHVGGSFLVAGARHPHSYGTIQGLKRGAQKLSGMIDKRAGKGRSDDALQIVQPQVGPDGALVVDKRDGPTYSTDPMIPILNNGMLVKQLNEEVLSAMREVDLQRAIQFRKQDRPWEIVPRLRDDLRVVDLVGLLKPEHRRELEEILDKMLPHGDCDCVLVVTPTVGFTAPHVFARSLLYDWGVGFERGNGLIILVCQQEGMIELAASPAIAGFFDKKMLQKLLDETLVPLLRQGDASYAIVQATYEIARVAQSHKDSWNSGMLSLPQRTKVLHGVDVVYVGAKRTWAFYICILCSALSGFAWYKISQMMCPDCYVFMHVVRDERLIPNFLDAGQAIEYKNGCTEFSIQRCPKCTKAFVSVFLREMYSDKRCLVCEDCNYHTLNMEEKVLKLPSRKEDGMKQLLFNCDHCHARKEQRLPLFRVLDDKPEEPWYEFLLERSQSANATADAHLSAALANTEEDRIRANRHLQQQVKPFVLFPQSKHA